MSFTANTLEKTGAGVFCRMTSDPSDPFSVSRLAIIRFFVCADDIVGNAEGSAKKTATCVLAAGSNAPRYFAYSSISFSEGHPSAFVTITLTNWAAIGAGKCEYLTDRVTTSVHRTTGLPQFWPSTER